MKIVPFSILVLLCLASVACGDEQTSSDAPDMVDMPDLGADVAFDSPTDEVTVEFEAESIRMALGASVRPEVLVDGRRILGAIEYEISTESDIVVVEDNTITAKQIGTATLNVRLEDATASIDLEVVAGQFKQVAAGNKSTCALAIDGTAWCWGYAGDSGTLKPIKLDGRPIAFSKIAVADRAGCGISVEEPAVYCWGSNSGRIKYDVGIETGVSTFQAGIAVDLTAGESHICAVYQDGAIACIGDNLQYQLGSPNSTSGPTVPDDQDFSSIHAGLRTTCALSESGTATCWGANWAGMIARGDYYILATELESPHTATAVYPGTRNLCWLTPDHDLKCRGYNWNGLMGEVDLDQYEVGARSFQNVKQASLRHETLCVVQHNGRLSCRGTNANDTVPNAPDTDIVSIPRTTDGLWQSVAMGHSHACAVSLDGEVYCWGLNDGGVVSPRPFGAYPAAVVPHLGGATALDFQFEHYCWTEIGGNAFCQGQNQHGQLGSGDFKSKASPVAVPLINVQTIGVSSDHTCALTDGSVFCWGNNADGQLNIPPTNADWRPRPRPYRIDLPEKATELDVGGTHACVIGESKKTYCWGYNAFGQASTRNAYSSPVNEIVIRDAGVPVEFASLALGTRRTCAISTTKSVWCWGEELNSPRPAHTFALPPVKSMRSGSFHSCAITEDDDAYCWGFVQAHDDSRNPILVASGVRDAIPVGVATCYVNMDGSVACEGGGGGLLSREFYGLPVTIPNFRSTGWITGEGGTVCGRTADGVACFGGDVAGFFFDDSVLRPQPTHMNIEDQIQ